MRTVNPNNSITRERLQNVTALVVEDESIISFMIEDMLLEFGCKTVVHARGSLQAIDAIERHAPDVAILDVNLGQDSIEPVADRLAADGIPFVFSTGYGRAGVPPRWAGNRPVLQKPFSSRELENALVNALPLAERSKSR